MKRAFVSSVKCANPFSNKPDIFLLELEALSSSMADYWLAVQKLREELGEQFECATFFCRGVWSNNSEEAEKLLDDHDFAWLDMMPEAKQMDVVSESRMRIFADGKLVFQAYDNEDGVQYESALVDVQDFLSDSEVRVQNHITS